MEEEKGKGDEMETKKKENRPRNKKRSDNTEMRKTPL